jgi:hypothetical protein
MREASSNQLGTTQRLQRGKTAAKSFFCNILPVSHYASIFCRRSPYPMPAKPLKADILAGTISKQMIAIYPADLSRHTKPFSFARLTSRQSSRLYGV